MGVVIPYNYLTKRRAERRTARDVSNDPYNFRSAYAESKPLQELLHPAEFEGTLRQVYAFLRKEERRDNAILAPSIRPFVARLKNSPEIARALIAHFVYSPPEQFRNNRPEEPIREHPVRIANLVCILNLDDRAVVGVLLHDDVEDGKAKLREDVVVGSRRYPSIERVFGSDTARDVDGYTIPEIPELRRLYAEARPDLNAMHVAEALESVLKNSYKDRNQIHKLEWREVIGKLCDMIGNAQDDANDAKDKRFTAKFTDLERKIVTHIHHREKLIAKLKVTFPGDRDHMEQIVAQIRVWSDMALAYRHDRATGPRDRLEPEATTFTRNYFRDYFGRFLGLRVRNSLNPVRTPRSVGARSRATGPEGPGQAA